MDFDFKQLADDLDIQFEGEQQGDEYVITLDNSNDFSTVYNKISENEDYECESDEQMTTTNNSLFRFTDGYVEITLTADYKKDIYRCTFGRK